MDRPGTRPATLPTVTEVAVTPQVSDATGEQGLFRLSRTDDGTGTFVVNFQFKGKARNGEDYTIKSVVGGARTGTKKFKVGELTKPLRVTPFNLGNGGGLAKAVKIVVLPGEGYQVGDPAVAKLKIVDAP